MNLCFSLHAKFDDRFNFFSRAEASNLVLTKYPSGWTIVEDYLSIMMDLLPLPVSWDDFLDFSLMREPSSSSITWKRLETNTAKFLVSFAWQPPTPPINPTFTTPRQGNYIWCWLVLTATVGILLKPSAVVSLVIVFLIYKAAFHLHLEGKLAGLKDGRLTGSRRPETDMALPRSYIIALAMVALVILHALSSAVHVGLAALGSLLVSTAHAACRPIDNEARVVRMEKDAEREREYERSQKEKYGYVSDNSDDEQVVFTSTDDVCPTLRQRAVVATACSTKAE